MGYYQSGWGQEVDNQPSNSPSIPGPFGGTDSDFGGGYSSLFTPGFVNELGGTNNPTQGPGIEQWQDQRLGMLGAATPVAQLPSWMQQQQGQFQTNANQSQAMQQNAFAQAQAQYNGADTKAQDQLRAAQGAQSGAIGSMARSATGGARGAAAAAGTAQQALGAAQGSQANAMTQQKLADKAAAADLMSQIGNQQRGVAQGEYGYQAGAEGDAAAYQQGWNATNDQAALWANTMQNNRQQADLGYQTQTAAANQQNTQFYQNLTNQYLGSGIQAGGQVLGGLGSYGGGSGNGNGYSNSYDGTIYQQSPY